jgi:hypothetical protein
MRASILIILKSCSLQIQTIVKIKAIKVLHENLVIAGKSALTDPEGASSQIFPGK